MEKPTPTLGQTLFMVTCGNLTRRNPSVGIAVTVCLVGRKYFHVRTTNAHTVAFHLNNWRQKTNYTADYMLYPSRQEWLETCERTELLAAVRKVFNDFGPLSHITLDQLRQIKTVLKL